MSDRRRPQQQRGAHARKGPSPARRAAFDALIQVEGKDAYANLALGQVLGRVGLCEQDAAFCTELVNGTSRLQGTYDRIIAAAAGRSTATLQPAVLTILRMAAHEQLSMRTPGHAAVDQAVNLSRAVIGQRVTGLVNAVSRKIGGHDLGEWVDLLTADQPPLEALALRTHHPVWIVEAMVDLLGAEEAEAALLANNIAPIPTLVLRPGLAERDELLTAGAQATRLSPHGVTRDGNPADLTAVRQGRAAVQDEGSQVMAQLLALAACHAAAGLPWLDLCAGPGGKAALLTGLARESGHWLLANEIAPHRARLVRQNLAPYPDGWQVVAGSGLAPAWQPQAFARVMADVPCTGLGSLRRRPESRWRRTTHDLAELVELQRDLFDQAWAALAPGGVLAYVTCSPHPTETVDQVSAFLQRTPTAVLLDAPALVPHIPDCAHPREPRTIQLWPHRHGTDAMFGALISKPPAEH